MQYHEVANLFPLLQGDEYERLKGDIDEHGQLEPIWTYEGQIIDGRNRYRACMDLGLIPQTKEWNGDGSLVAFVVSLNLHRRHLTSSQRAALAVDILPQLESEAKERQGARNDINLVEKIPPSKSRDIAAELMNTNPRYVSDAKKLKEEAPELFEQVKVGELKMTQAKRKHSMNKKHDPPPMPASDKYRVFYADPPWQYGNSGAIGEGDNYGRAERHYPTMSIDKLCLLPIRDMAEDNAVLFVWVTSPLLEACFTVIKAWGFKYKTSFVWDKVGHNFGHYNSVRHELLLVCTRGSCTPDNAKLFDSVQSIEKSKRHSEKPEQFRDIIDTLYTHGNKIELFARKKVEGWDSWGNE